MSLVGTWDVTIKSPVGDQNVTLEFSDEHTGIARYGSDSVQLQNVSVKDDKASWDVSVTQPMRLTLKCAVVIAGNELTGTASAGFFGKFAVTGRRIVPAS